jgi:hypothetical protein
MRKTGHFGHPDVQEKSRSTGVGFQGLKGMQGIVADGNQLQNRKLAYIQLQEFAGHLLVFDNMTPDTHVLSMLRVIA